MSFCNGGMELLSKGAGFVSLVGLHRGMAFPGECTVVF